MSCGFKNGFHGYNACSSCGAAFVKSRTQKGKGIEILQNGVGSPLTLIGIVQKEEHINEGIEYPVFARPAPSKPRHGYIDSRVVKTEKQLRNLLKEVLADDPGGEILLCPFISSYCSSIWTPGSLTVGAGHDGATAGIQACNIPLASGHMNKGPLKGAEIGEDSWPYVEVVYEAIGKTPIYVQLREGPKLEGITGNYIPKPVIVEKILHADPKKYQDLGWEQEIEAHKNQPGVIVWHPNGTITDHFSIHAFASKLPIVFDRQEPEIGSFLEPTNNTESFNPKSMLEGIVIGDRVKLPLGDVASMKPFASAAFVALHHAAKMTGENSKWIGVAAAILLKMGTAALMGEARHLGGNPQNSREEVYGKAEKKNLTELRARTNALVNIFRYGRWSGSFGGLKWACCGAATIELFNAVQNLAAEPTEESAANLVMALNLVVNQAHNGGWWLNKFISHDLYTEIQKGTFTHVVPAGSAFFTYYKEYMKMETSDFAAAINKIREWGKTYLNPPRTKSASLVHFPALKTLEISVATELLKTHTKKITVPVTKLGDITTSEIKNHLYLVEGEDGYQLEYRKNDPIVIWRDKPLKEEAEKMAKLAKYNH
ncbi:MAG: hypothetical protein AB7J46_06690 [Candidatus Altimarinota bacterium]